jgi:PAS domain S-box-containing protein
VSNSSELIVHDLVLPITEAQEMLCAIRNGEVDALVVSDGGRQQVFVLKGADHAHRILLETLNEGAATIAADATILYANRMLAELLGQRLERVLGVPLTRFVKGDDAIRFAAVLAAASHGRSKGEVSLVSAGGTLVPVMLSMSAAGEGLNESYTVVVTDLTALKQAQAALQQANSELEARVTARTHELLEANTTLQAEIVQRYLLEEELRRKAAELIEAHQRKDEFLSMLAHELRNPLAPILTAAELIRLAITGRADLPDLERYQGVIARQVHNLARLVDDLLDVSRITRGNVTLRKQPVDLAAIVAGAVDAARPSIDQHGHALRVELPAEPLRILADATRCEQVLVNLLNNAAKFTDRGGNITLSAERRGGEVVLRVRDDGMGISPELLPRVFDLFVQGERTLERAQGGLGIGLTLVKSLVEMHGGAVEARSEGAGRGSEMVIRLPLLSPREVASISDPVERPASAPPPSGRRVLIVDDNTDTAQMLTDLVSLWGHDAARASSGEDALRLAEAFQPHVVLMDIGLPGMDGYEVARRLRRGGGAEPLLVGITGYGQASDRSRAREAGFDHYLTKPPDPVALQDLLTHDSAAGVTGGASV